MISHLLELLAHFIISLIESSGYLGIFILMTLESALIPLPSEVTMPFSGFLVTQGTFNFWFVVLAGSLGNLVGSLMAYCLGFYLEESLLRRMVVKWGKFILLTEDDYDKAERWLNKYGEIISFTSRLLPAVRTFISLPVGVAKMNVIKFSIYTFIGSFLWSIFLTFIGVKLGENWHSISDYFHKFDLVIGILLVAAVVFYIWHKWPRKKKNNESGSMN